MILQLGIFIISLATLIIGSNKFIDSAERIGLSLGISPFIIGVTLVSFGTSLPELTTSILSVLSGSSEIVVGNVVGSNITNILLVLGTSAIAVRTLKIERDIMSEDVPLLFGSSILLWFVLRDLHFSMFEAILFLFGLCGFLMYSIQDRGEDNTVSAKPGAITYVILALGAIAIFFGAKYTVSSMESLASSLDISPSLISISLLALGTSLPEVVVSVSAARKGKHAIAVGNVLGSNIFNTYAVMAIPSFFGELIIPASITTFALPFMVVTTILFSLVCYSKSVSFWKAAMLISFYIFFIAELIRLGFVNSKASRATDARGQFPQ